jgi:hypothetical protein
MSSLSVAGARASYIALAAAQHRHPVPVDSWPPHSGESWEMGRIVLRWLEGRIASARMYNTCDELPARRNSINTRNFSRHLSKAIRRHDDAEVSRRCAGERALRPGSRTGGSKTHTNTQPPTQVRDDAMQKGTTWRGVTPWSWERLLSTQSTIVLVAASPVYCSTRRCEESSSLPSNATLGSGPWAVNSATGHASQYVLSHRKAR